MRREGKLFFQPFQVDLGVKINHLCTTLFLKLLFIKHKIALHQCFSLHNTSHFIQIGIHRMS